MAISWYNCFRRFGIIRRMWRGDSSGSGSGDGKDLKGEAKGEGSSTVAQSLKN